MTDIAPILARIASALERMAPPAPAPVAWQSANAFVWQPPLLQPVPRVNAVPLALLQGVEAQRETLLQNTRAFAAGRPANNALLWGARGTGKSSLVKAVHATVNQEKSGQLVLVEIHREDIESLPQLLALTRQTTRRIILFCDDLSFGAEDTRYKSLKAVLEGGVEGRPDHVVLYATSNRRHLLARSMTENERAAAIHDGEAIDENVSLSDRFGLWLGFHHLDQATYLSIVDGYARHFGLQTPADILHADALEWATTRGSRSGRVAWQFIQAAQAKGADSELK